MQYTPYRNLNDRINIFVNSEEEEEKTTPKQTRFQLIIQFGELKQLTSAFSYRVFGIPLCNFIQFRFRFC